MFRWPSVQGNSGDVRTRHIPPLGTLARGCEGTTAAALAGTLPTTANLLSCVLPLLSCGIVECLLP